MPQAIVWIFLAISSVFAAVHNVAITMSLYWYYSWFDIVMHFWGGVLIVMGVFALCSLKHIPLKPTFVIVFCTLSTVMITWEIFERIVGLYNQPTYIFDVSKDLLVGFCGGVVGYIVAIRIRM